MADTNYTAEAESDAQEMAINFLDEIVEQLLEDGEASTDLYNDYSAGDQYHHESHVDKCYDLREAVDIIEQLDEYEESDSGLWEGQDMKEAIATCAAYTYGNAVMGMWQDIIDTINGDCDVEDAINRYKEAKEAEEAEYVRVTEYADEDGFLDAIAEDPTDATTRLVYADWLEEREYKERADEVRADGERLKDVPSLENITDEVRNVIKG